MPAALGLLAACSQDPAGTPVPAASGSKAVSVWFREEARARSGL
ncbi:MAG: hypothetical protein ACKO32_03685 [Planctomycetia bacterium]